MTYIITKALAPIFLILLLGYWAGKAKLVDNANVSILNIFLMDFSLPAALFLATVMTPWAGIYRQLPLVAELTLAMWVAYAVVYWLCVKVWKKSSADAAVLALTVALPNYAALGLPILNGVFGEGTGTSLNVAVAIATGAVMITPVCLMLLERAKAAEKGATDSGLSLLLKLIYLSFKKPIVFGPLAGVAGSAMLGAFRTKLPELAQIAIRPLGLAALATALFLTGVILSARKLKVNGAVLVSALVKNLIQPFIAWGVVLLFGIDPVVGRAGILLIALSAGFFGVVFWNRYGVQSPDAEGALLVSTGAFVVTIPLFILITAPMVHP
jgi:malonate transporter